MAQSVLVFEKMCLICLEVNDFMASIETLQIDGKTAVKYLEGTLGLKVSCLRC